VTESEALTYHYELDLRNRELRPDPRIGHTLTLSTNEYGQPLQSVAIAYPRVRPFREETPTLPVGTEALIREVQRELHLSYTEPRYTNDEPRRSLSLARACEVSTYELTVSGRRMRMTVQRRIQGRRVLYSMNCGLSSE
jgi:hypothetical protein